MRTLDGVGAVAAKFHGIHDSNLAILYTAASVTVEVGLRTHLPPHDEIDVLVRTQLVRDLAKELGDVIIQPTMTRQGIGATLSRAGSFHANGMFSDVPVTITASLSYHECERLESLGIGGA